MTGECLGMIVLRGALRGALATPLAYTGANGSQQAAQLSPRADTSPLVTSTFEQWTSPQNEAFGRQSGVRG